MRGEKEPDKTVHEARQDKEKGRRDEGRQNKT